MPPQLACVGSVGEVARVMTVRLELFVRDPAASAAFYRDVLDFAIERKVPGQHIVARRGAVTIGLGLIDRLQPPHPLRPLSRDERRGIGVEIVLEVDDVRTCHARVLETGWPLNGPLQERSWGLTDFRILDPDGYYLRITSKNR